MRIYDIIKEKRDGKALSVEEIEFFVKGYTDGSIPDYQAAALLMAIYFQGMNRDETIALTMAMARSGDMVDLSGITGLKADKHSTGGVGDKTTLIVAPIVAACGIKVAKMSGRGLGHTGGTIDKLEAIKGYQTALPREKFLEITNKIGLSVIGQSGNLAPADKRLYALRDVTATVESLPLIVSSIMSKKIAVGADCIVLDVKTGSGAFCKTLEETTELAGQLVSVGKGAGKKVTAVITNMDIPLGYAIGNSLEVIESVESLCGKGPEDLIAVSLTLAAHMLKLCGKGNIESCYEQAKNALEQGKAYKCFLQMVEAHGGDTDILKDLSLFPKAKYQIAVKSKSQGFIQKTDTEKLGVASLLLGAGRLKKEDGIDHQAGIILKKKTGDYVNKGETLAIMHTNDENRYADAEKVFFDALSFGANAPEKEKTVFGSISSQE